MTYSTITRAELLAVLQKAQSEAPLTEAEFAKVLDFGRTAARVATGSYEYEGAKCPVYGAGVYDGQGAGHPAADFATEFDAQLHVRLSHPTDVVLRVTG